MWFCVCTELGFHAQNMIDIQHSIVNIIVGKLHDHFMSNIMDFLIILYRSRSSYSRRSVLHSLSPSVHDTIRSLAVQHLTQEFNFYQQKFNRLFRHYRT
jgi:Na+/phosphate symporter